MGAASASVVAVSTEATKALMLVAGAATPKVAPVEASAALTAAKEVAAAAEMKAAKEAAVARAAAAASEVLTESRAPEAEACSASGCNDAEVKAEGRDVEGAVLEDVSVVGGGPRGSDEPEEQHRSTGGIQINDGDEDGGGGGGSGDDDDGDDGGDGDDGEICPPAVWHEASAREESDSEEMAVQEGGVAAVQQRRGEALSMGERLEEIDEEMVDEPLAIGEVIEVEVGGGDGTWLPAEVIDISSSADGRFVVMVDGDENFEDEVGFARACTTEGHALREPGSHVHATEGEAPTAMQSARPHSFVD